MTSLRKDGRGERIRTSDPLNPIEAKRALFHKLARACMLFTLYVPVPGTASGALEFPDDPRALDAWAMYSRAGNCAEARRCVDGYRTRQLKRRWMPIYVADLGLPADTAGIYVTGLLNVTHPSSDRSTCKLFVMLASDTGMEDVDARRDRQWVFRVQSSPETGSLRVTQGTPLKVTAGRFWLRFWYAGSGDFDAGRCSYGIRLSVAAWLGSAREP